MSLSNHSFKEMDRGLGGSRLIEELDHQGQIDVKSQHVVRVNLAIGAKAGDASEDSDSLHRVLVMQRRKDLPHQICAAALIAFAQIDANHEDVSRHSVAPSLQVSREIGAAERRRESDDDGQDHIEPCLEELAALGQQEGFHLES